MTGKDEEFFRERTLARSKALRRIGWGDAEATPPAPSAGPPDEPPAPPAANRAPPVASDAAVEAGGSAPAPNGAARARPPGPAAAAAAARPHMVDVGAKPVVHREATAEGFLRLQGATLDALRLGTAPKGDPFPAAQVAGILAAKATPQLIPLCHPLPLTGIEVDLLREAGGVRCRATVRTDGKTGVEMEALAAVTAALLTVWDMTKALEKDERGQYPGTAIEGVRVVSKTKGGAA